MSVTITNQNIQQLSTFAGNMVSSGVDFEHEQGEIIIPDVLISDVTDWITEIFGSTDGFMVYNT